MPKKKRSAQRSGLLWRLRRHLQADPGKLAVLEQTFQGYERPNLHLAIEELLKEMPEKPQQMGVLTQHEYDSARLAKMSRASTGWEDGLKRSSWKSAWRTGASATPGTVEQPDSAARRIPPIQSLMCLPPESSVRLRMRRGKPRSQKVKISQPSISRQQSRRRGT